MISKHWRRAVAVAFGASVGSAYPDVSFAAVDSTGPASSPAADSLEWLSFAIANSEEEIYVRYLQIAGRVRLYPWSSRSFSDGERRHLSVRRGSHPWTGAAPFVNQSQRISWLPADVRLRHNLAFPYGSNDAAVWAGRGATGAISAGVTARIGPLSLVLAPAAFIAQNASFDLLENGATGIHRFGDAYDAGSVDRPQRFGNGAYGRLDPGNSTLRLDAGVVAIGASTANMSWGPFERYPYVLGSNAPGFLHGFAGTARPVNLWVGSIHGRVVWGRLEQSEYSPVEGSPTYVSPAEPGTRRFASGLVLIFEPRGAPGLELGLTRFFHSPWPRSGLPASYFAKPFENILKNRLKGAPGFTDPGTTADNQLISGFARWAFPGAGFELYAEYGREDHSWDKRDFVQEPDHSRAYGLGFRKTLGIGPARLDGLTFELINFQLPHLARTLRGEGGVYTHTVMRQGHTHRGQLLGADVGVGSASGSMLRWDRFRPKGRTSFALHREVREERGTFYGGGADGPKSSHVQYALDVQRMRRFRKVELTAGVALIAELNRDFARDAMSASAVLGARVPIGQ